MYKIWTDNVCLGESDLEMFDESMNVRSGRFSPLQPYWQVRSVFRLFSQALEMQGASRTQALEKYYSARDRLGLSLRDNVGSPVSVGEIHIIDVNESDDDLRIEVYPPK